MTIHYNTITKEPYLRLPAPHSRIIITPYRIDRISETADRQVEILNHPKVYPWLEGPPYPFRYEDGEGWIRKCHSESEAVLAEIRREFKAASDGEQTDRTTTTTTDRTQGQRKFYNKCPFVCIREILEEDPETGHPVKDIFIGDAMIDHYQFTELRHRDEEMEAAQKKNLSLPAGDENIVWGFGDFLDPAYHGRGIMTAALRVLIHDWAIPRLNARVIKSCLYEGNHGSLRVFEKNGFVKGETLENWVAVSEGRGGGMRSIVLVEWHRQDE